MNVSESIIAARCERIRTGPYLTEQCRRQTRRVLTYDNGTRLHDCGHHGRTN